MSAVCRGYEESSLAVEEGNGLREAARMSKSKLYEGELLVQSLFSIDLDLNPFWQLMRRRYC